MPRFLLCRVLSGYKNSDCIGTYSKITTANYWIIIHIEAIHSGIPFLLDQTKFICVYRLFQGSASKNAPYYMGSTASLPRSGLLRAYSPAVTSIPPERLKTLPSGKKLTYCAV